MSAPHQILHRENIPAEGALVLSSQLSLIALKELEQLFSGREVTWLLEQSTTLDPEVELFLRHAKSGAMYSATDSGLEKVGEQFRDFLKNGGVMIHVGAPAVAKPNTTCHLSGAQLKAICRLKLPVLPVAVSQPRLAKLQLEEESSLPEHSLSIATLITAQNLSPAAIHQSLFAAAQAAFTTRPLFSGSLAVLLLKGLKKYGSTRFVHDGSDDSSLGFDKVLAASLALSRELKKETDKDRVGIVLPPGKAGLIANLAVVFAGKTPVNFNFTAGIDAIRSTLRQADVDRIISADTLVRKLPTFPWPANRNILLMERLIPQLSNSIKYWAVFSKLLSAEWLVKWLKLDQRQNEDEAVLLFTSGSSGDPKGVVLSHRNVLANIAQFAPRLSNEQNPSLLGCLPLFHSFGSTVTLWYPILEGVDLVTYPNPLESKRLAELIEQHHIQILLATPTFLRGYMKRVEASALKSLKLIVTGAEKLPLSFADAFEEKFGIRPQEGYGLTETSPVANVNFANLCAETGKTLIESSRNGSVGHLMPGMAIRLTDPDSGADIPLSQQGMIWLKGDNVFRGYLNQASKTAEVIVDDWFKTGDIGRLDDDGFLFIEGRMSRFSKIAGEMVPHETVEAAVVKVLGLDSESERKIAVVGVPDEQKGEALVLLSTVAGDALSQECTDLRYKLIDVGLASLWCPKSIVKVRIIPVLASGKLDIKACEQLARN